MFIDLDNDNDDDLRCFSYYKSGIIMVGASTIVTVY
jgi:hypothetical protein